MSLPTQEDYIIDAWSPLSFKRSVGTAGQSTSFIAPTWVGEHARRLTAYKVLAAYRGNTARTFRPDGGEGETNRAADLRDRNEIREYGDPAVIVAQVVAALLGDKQEIVTEGADEIPSSQTIELDPESGEVIAGEATTEENDQAAELQDWLRAEMDSSRLSMKMLETERNSVNMGDGVYTLGYDSRKGRVVIRVWDPGFYFPVLTDGPEDDFPEKVHLAWEVSTNEDRAANRLRVRRITWELVPVVEETEEGVIAVGSVHYDYDDTGIESDMRCVMSDGTWLLDRARGVDVEDFTEGSAEWETYVDEDGEVKEFRDVDLGIDFIPLVHIPNTVALLDHYGQSTLATVLQIIDDLQNADSDLAAAATTAAIPPVALGGAVGDSTLSYKPGVVWQIGDGSLNILDTSKALDALIGYIEFLLKRLSTNVRLPEAVLGRVDASEVPSGVALALSFGPLETMVKEMRLVRSEKYPLLLEFYWRMSLVNEVEGVPQTWTPSRISFGSFLPQDRAAAVLEVTTLIEKGVISLETAVRLLVEAGFEIDDAIEEVNRIREQDFDGAGQLLDATGDEGLVLEYLGRRATNTNPASQPQTPSTPIVDTNPTVET